MPGRSPTWRERWLGLRNTLIANPRFQRWAAGFPLTRPTARREAGALFDLVAGFVYSQTLSACVRLRVFEILADGPQTTATAAARLALSEPAAATLLKAAAALDLTEQLPDGRYVLGRLGAALRGNPALSAMIEHHAMLYADLADPVALLRGEQGQTRLAAFWAYARSDFPAGAAVDEVRAYSALMTESQGLVAGEVLDAYPLRRHRRLLDIGGGEGAFLSAAAARHPDLGLMLFDLPAVARRAVMRFQAPDLARRAAIFEGDFFRDPLPRGADVASLVRVLHDHDDPAALALLRKIHGALPPGGVVLIAEPMAGTPGAHRMGDAYFGLYLTAMGSGRPRTAAEIAGLLGKAGFHGVASPAVRTPLLTSVMVATA